MAKELAEAEYDTFHRERIAEMDTQPMEFDRSIVEKGEELKRLPKSRNEGKNA